MQVPLALVFEGRIAWKLLAPERLSATTSANPGAVMNIYDESALHLLRAVGFNGVLQLDYKYNSCARDNLDGALFLGCCFWLYNQMSFIVLGRVSFLTHATFNVMRRVFIIGITTWWFKKQTGPMNVIGIVLALSGFALFLAQKVLCEPATIFTCTNINSAPPVLQENNGSKDTSVSLTISRKKTFPCWR
jgi:hypothetical protein